jgi:hypothetical protein
VTLAQEILVLKALVAELDQRVVALAAGCKTLCKIIDEHEARLKAVEDMAHPPVLLEPRLLALENRHHIGCGCRLEDDRPIQHLLSGQ